MAWTSPGANNSIKSSLAAALAKRQKTWTPWTAPTTPPAGTYDPALDAQAGAAQRGYDYLVGDVSDANARSTAELGFTVQGLRRQQGRSLSDLLTAKTRFGEDQSTAATREGQDYGRATADLGTSYARLGESQAGAALMTGTALQGGTIAAALAKRTENQAHDQSGLDLQHTRFGENLATANTRYNTDYATNVGRVNEDFGTDDLGAIGQATRQYGYGVSDLAKQQQQAGIENVNYQADVGDQRWFQAAQAGYVAPKPGEVGGRPTNEYTAPDGSAYRVVVRGTRRYIQTPDGNEKFAGTRPKKKR
jgi:hypothetical protein